LFEGASLLTEMKKKIILVYIILCLCFIWGQSMLPGSESAQESGFVLERIVHPFEEHLFGQASSTEGQVRKAAHVFEYMMLSLGLSAFFAMRAKERGEKTARWMFSAFSAGLFTALIDETVQLFSGRGSMVSDVWIDGIGVFLGIAIIWIIERIRRK